MPFSYPTLLLAFILVVVYALAAVPWVLLGFDERGTLAQQGRRALRNPFDRRASGLVLFVIGLLVIAPPVIVFLLGSLDPATLETLGMVYGSTLQLQLIVDFFIIGFPILMLIWPKGGAVAYAAFREGVRQPLFWVLFAFGFLALIVSPIVPYFTFGEDLVMVKDLGFDTMMLMAALFGTLAASQSISEEIEGRTAVTLMSKPVSRRQFLLGKFLGILLASLLLFALLGWLFQGVLPHQTLARPGRSDAPATWLTSVLSSLNLHEKPTALVRGVGLWTDSTLSVLPGLVMTFSEVMVLIAVAVALATRATLVVNLSTVLAIYFLANVTPVLVTIGGDAKHENARPGVGIAVVHGRPVRHAVARP